ncbi:transglycosylase family protein [Tsukamurella strandjordii]|uniref:transglycosylase family protein n=1 Tax=Tsukamurella strandjordii TaxID=147577 RepID=UPI003F705442
MPGRHRAPSTVRRSTVRAAAAGALLGGAGLALTAPTAGAATDAQWDRVAACESSGNWSLNTGNGYHGGLQFSPSTWNAYGGQQYAPRAYMATKAQQIAIAEKVLAGQGKGAWSSCGRGLGAPTPRTVPATSEAPKVTQPKAQAPKAQTPKAQAPKTQAPKTQTPKVQEPTLQAPKAQAPKAQAPAAKPPKSPAAKPAVPGAAASSFAQQILQQAQAGGQQVDPAVSSALQQAITAGY